MVGDNALDNNLKLFVSNIPFSVTRYHLQCHFQQFGPLNLNHTTIKTNRRGKRIAFVAYNTEECLEIALRSSPHFLNGEFLQVFRMKRERDGVDKLQEPVHVDVRSPEGVVDQAVAQTEVKVLSTEDSQMTANEERLSSREKRQKRGRSWSRRSGSFSGERSRSASSERSRSLSRTSGTSSESSSTSDTKSESESPIKLPKSTELSAAEAVKYQKELEEELLNIKKQTADVESERKRRRERWKNRKHN